MREVSKKTGGGRNAGHIILSIVYVLAMAAFTAMIIWLNVLPMKYLIPALAVILIGSILVVLFLNVKKKKSKRRVAGIVVAVALIAVYAVGTYYIYSTQDLFAKISTIGQATEEYYVVTTADNENINTLDDLAGRGVLAFDAGSPTYKDAEERLSEMTSINFRSRDNLFGLVDEIAAHRGDAMLVSEIHYNMLCEDSKKFEKKTKVIYTLTIKSDVGDVAKTVDRITTTPFNILISGIDIFGDINEISLSDVNMIMTVNPETKTILLTSIPRDSYVMLHTSQGMDKLTHTGAFGINETMMTVEDMMNTPINYYIRVNFSTVIDVVDAIGGITVESEYDFTTHGRQNTGYSFVKGTNELDGKSALAFARERYSFEDGDMQRNKHQQIVIKAMLDKILSSETLLTKYTQLLDAVEDEMQTSLSAAEIQALVKMQINDMSEWHISQQSIMGGTGSAYCSSVGMNLSVVYPDAGQVTRASNKINGVLNGAEQADGEWTWDY